MSVPTRPAGSFARVALVSALVLGIAVRLYAPGRQSLWLDELTQVHTSSAPTVEAMFTRHLRDESHPPFFSLVLHFWIRAFGDSEAALRAPSVLAGVVSLPVFYLAFAPVLGPAPTLAATLLLAFCNPGLRYSQEARGYGFLFLFSTLSTAAWLALIRRHEARAPYGRRLMLGYVASASLAMYVHYFAVGLAGVQMLCLGGLAMRDRLNRVAWCWLAGGILLTYSPWVVPMLQLVLTKTGREGADLSVLTGTALLAFTFTADYGSSLVLMTALVALPLLLLGVGLKDRACRFWRGLDQPASAGRWLAVMVLVSVAGLVLVSLRNPILVPRRLIFLLPAWYALLGLWMCSDVDAHKVGRTGWGRLMAAVLLWSPVLLLQGWLVRTVLFLTLPVSVAVLADLLVLGGLLAFTGRSVWAAGARFAKPASPEGTLEDRLTGWRARAVDDGAAGILFAITLATFIFLLPRHLGPERDQWREATAEVLGSYQPGDAIVLVEVAPVVMHYFRKAGLAVTAERVENRPASFEQLLARLQPRLVRHLYVFCPRSAGELTPDTARVLETRASRPAVTRFLGLVLYRYDLAAGSG